MPLTVRTDYPDPRPGPGEARVCIRCCALCRTDLHVIEGDLPQRTLPIIPGHQMVGQVDALGQGCTRLQCEQRVGIAWLRRTCGQCVFCGRDQENLSEQSIYTGYDADGGYAEYAVVPEPFAYEIPDVFDDASAVPLLCGGIIGYRALDRANVPRHGRLLLVGFGSSAHVVLPLALHRGNEVFVLTRSTGHQQLARDLGAARAGSDAADFPAQPDSAIIFAPDGALVPPVLAMLPRGDTLALAEIHMSNTPSLDYGRHLYGERDVRSVTANTRRDGQQLLAEAARDRVKPRTTPYVLDDANRALQDMKASRIDGTGVLHISD